jgi:hypothetical protein
MHPNRCLETFTRFDLPMEVISTGKENRRASTTKAARFQILTSAHGKASDYIFMAADVSRADRKIYDRLDFSEAARCRAAAGNSFFQALFWPSALPLEYRDKRAYFGSLPEHVGFIVAVVVRARCGWLQRINPQKDR